MAILRARPRGKWSPWADLIVADMRRMASLVARCANMPDPEADPGAWARRAVKEPLQWKQDVSMMHFTDSMCDRAPQANSVSTLRPFGCMECSVAFAAKKQLDQHNQIKHGKRCAYRLFAHETAVCQVCGVQLVQRIRLLTHLRHSACGSEVTTRPHAYKQLSLEEAARLDELDNALFRESRRLGHSTPLARGAARKTDGSITGTARL